MSFSIVQASITADGASIKCQWQYTTGEGSVGNTTTLQNTDSVSAKSIDDAKLIEYLKDQLPTMSTTDDEGNPVPQTIDQTLTAQIAEQAAREAEEAKLVSLDQTR